MLRKLTLIGLHKLPNGLFRNLTILNQLSLLELKDVNDLPQDVFQGMVHLISLDIDGRLSNGMQYPEAIFSGLTSLQQLRIHNLDPGMLSGLLQNLRNLKNLHLIGYKAKKLPYDIFRYNTQLEEIKLEDNHLDEIIYPVFQGLVNLKSIYLSCNRGGCVQIVIPSIVLGSVLTLRSLTIERYDISYVKFNGIQDLHEFHLYENEGVNSTTLKIVKQWKSLEVLSISSCDIPEITDHMLN